MAIKYPIKYIIEPDAIDAGTHWVIIKLKNIGTETLRFLDVNLKSLNSNYLKVQGNGEYVSDLKQDMEEIVPFQVLAKRSTNLYASLNGRRNDEYFKWVSPTFMLNVGIPKAEIEKPYSFSHPCALMGKSLEVETVVTGKVDSEDLVLEFWVEKPDFGLERITRIEIKELLANEQVRCNGEFKPDKEGLYKVYTYLKDANKIIGRIINSINVYNRKPLRS